MRTLTEPILCVAPWSNARSVIEISSISLWLLDISIDADERIKRLFAYRYHSLNGQKTFAETQNDSNIISVARKRLDRVIAQATALGIHLEKPKKKTKSKITLVRMPSTTKLIATQFKDPSLYSLLSAVTHGEHWAFQQSSFRVVEIGNDKYFEPNITLPIIRYLTNKVFNAVTKQTLTKFLLFGWPTDELTGTFSKTKVDLNAMFDELEDI